MASAASRLPAPSERGGAEPCAIGSSVERLRFVHIRTAPHPELPCDSAVTTTGTRPQVWIVVHPTHPR